MGAQKITEQQFRTRRRDRKMIWVDAAAFLLGLLIVVASVGGVILIEPERDPIEWRYSFAETRMPDRNVCVGIELTDAERRGCADRDNPPIREFEPALEGEQIEFPGEYPGEKWYVAVANVTSVTFELTWIDEIPPTTSDDGCESQHCNRNYDQYDENSTDILRLDIYTPNGDHYWNQSANAADPEKPDGSIRIRIPFIEHEGGTIEAFTQEEALKRLNETYHRATHDATGQWRTVVTIIRAGDIEGTVPINACTSAGIDQDTQNQTGTNEHCYTYDEWAEHSDLAWYTLTYGNDFMDPFRDQIPYSSSLADEGNTWQLKMTIRTYEARVSL